MSNRYTPRNRTNQLALATRRVAALERAKTPSGGGGIQFNTDPQSGSYLRISTTRTVGYGTYLESAGTFDIRSVGTLTLLSTADGEFHTGGAMTIDSTGGIVIQNITSGAITITNTIDAGIEIHDYGTTASNGITVTSDNAYLTLKGYGISTQVVSDYFYIKLGTSQRLQVLNHTPVAIFEVREDGTIHGKTGGSITWDL